MDAAHIAFWSCGPWPGSYLALARPDQTTRL